MTSDDLGPLLELEAEIPEVPEDDLSADKLGRVGVSLEGKRTLKVEDGCQEVLGDDQTWLEDGMEEDVPLEEGQTCYEEDFPVEDELDSEDCHQGLLDEEDDVELLQDFCQILPGLVLGCCQQTPG